LLSFNPDNSELVHKLVQKIPSHFFVSLPSFSFICHLQPYAPHLCFAKQCGLTTQFTGAKHSTPNRRQAFNSDRRRDARLMLLGWRVVRFTWQQVTDEPAYVAATLRGLLAS
jgi:hypothetical protein